MGKKARYPHAIFLFVYCLSKPNNVIGSAKLTKENVLPPHDDVHALLLPQSEATHPSPDTAAEIDGGM